MRETVKRGLEGVLVETGLTRISRVLRPGRGVVLGYHNVVPDGLEGRGDAPLHLPRSRFAGQLDRLLRTHRVVSLPELLEGADAEAFDPDDEGRPLACLTFDDAYRGALTVGLEELRARDLPATIFVSPRRLGDRPFWWDAFAHAEDSGRVPGLRRHALDALGGVPSAVWRWAREEGLEPASLPELYLPGRLEELDRAARTPGVSLAAHGWSHRSLTGVSGEELARELEEPLRWLRRVYRSSDPWLAYPYGRTSEAVGRAARAAGYRGAVRIDGGWVPPSPEPLSLPRVSVPAGVSGRGFDLRISGVWSR